MDMHHSLHRYEEEEEEEIYEEEVLVIHQNYPTRQQLKCCSHTYVPIQWWS
jgi:hypothetical protein